jgi:hypothetical protein
VSLSEQNDELTTGAIDHRADLSSVHIENCYASSPPVGFFDEGSIQGTTIHAVATPDDEALASPLTRKVAIPPRVSSKRAPVPFYVTPPKSQMVHATATAASRCREAKSGDAQWPLLNIEGNNASDSMELHIESVKTTRLGGNDACLSNAHGVSGSLDTYNIAKSHPVSTDSGSPWSQAAGSLMCNGEPQAQEPGYRTKRLSDHCSKSEPGPLLKIAEDADAILLGKDMPPLPDMTASRSLFRRESLSTLTTRTMSRLSARVGRSRTPKTLTECVASRLPIRAGLRQSVDSPRSTLTKGADITIRKHPPKVIPKPAIVASARTEQHPATPSDFVNTSRSKSSPVPIRTSPPCSRTGASPSYARSTVASSRNMSMLNQHAVLRNSTRSSSHPSEQKFNLSETRSNNDSETSRKKENQTAGEKNVKTRRSIRNMILSRDTKEKIPPVPAVPPTPKRSSLIGSAFGGRFKSTTNLRNQGATGQTPCRAVPRGQDSNTQSVLSPSTESNYEATSANLHAQRATEETTRRMIPKVQDGNAQSVPSPDVGSHPRANSTPDGVTTINNILDHMLLLPETRSDRLRSLEIAEVCTSLSHRTRTLEELVLTVQMKQALLASLDAYKHAQIAATQAEQSARQAELSAQRSAVEIGRLFQLCKEDLAEEAVQLIKGLCRNTWDSPFASSLSTTLRAMSNPQ